VEGHLGSVAWEFKSRRNRRERVRKRKHVELLILKVKERTRYVRLKNEKRLG
jgi:hypothetical protein